MDFGWILSALPGRAAWRKHLRDCFAAAMFRLLPLPETTRKGSRVRRISLAGRDATLIRDLPLYAKWILVAVADDAIPRVARELASLRNETSRLCSTRQARRDRTHLGFCVLQGLPLA